LIAEATGGIDSIGPEEALDFGVRELSHWSETIPAYCEFSEHRIIFCERLQVWCERLARVPIVDT
jgi:hypothetical protein